MSPATNPAARPRAVMATGQAAALLSVSPKTVTAWAAAGKLPSARTRGGHYRFQRANVTALLARVGRYDTPTGIRRGTAWHPHAPRRPRGVTRQLVWHLHDQGLTGRQIARRLTIREPAVRHHLRHGRPLATGHGHHRPAWPPVSGQHIPQPDASCKEDHERRSATVV
jgi:excisionase family DNA binding protein